MKISLVRPNEIYKDSFLKGLKELHQEQRFLTWNLQSAEKDFSTFIHETLNKSLSGVPETLLWGILDETHYVGRISIRHELNDSLQLKGGHIGFDIRRSYQKQGFGKELLRQGLLFAADLGLKKVLLTTDTNNLSSQKIIIHNGGLLEKIENDICYYWITLK